MNSNTSTKNETPYLPREIWHKILRARSHAMLQDRINKVTLKIRPVVTELRYYTKCAVDLPYSVARLHFERMLSVGTVDSLYQWLQLAERGLLL